MVDIHQTKLGNDRSKPNTMRELGEDIDKLVVRAYGQKAKEVGLDFLAHKAWQSK